MNEPIDAIQASAELVGGLTEVLRVALADQFPATRADVEDIEQLLDALHLLRPELPELRMFDGFVQVVRADWHAAIETFSTLAASSQCLPGSKAMLAYCLDATSDVSWRQLALELLDDPRADAQVRLLAQALVARNDMEDARMVALRTGRFTEPESLRTLHGTGGAAAGAEPHAPAAPAAPAPEPQYLRL
ncbi:HrpB1 family type III secretion system apparatus protein [Trinickia dinghuensis]|nr:HrpB1 family type III secretion system apparatus protein [Trinickia dinghuensis]